MYLIFDTETTGVPHNRNAPLDDLENWPRLVQLAWQLHDRTGRLLTQHSYLVKPEGFNIPFKAEQVHGISTRRAQDEGIDLLSVLQAFITDLLKARLLVGHNIEFDNKILGAELIRRGLDPDQLLSLPNLDTAEAATEFCQLPGGPGGKLKMPRLEELHSKLFGKAFDEAHDASYDVAATARCFFGLLKRSIVTPIEPTLADEIIYEEPKLAGGVSARREARKEVDYSLDEQHVATATAHAFAHLHVHSQYSILQATPEISKLVAAAAKTGMPAVAITDLGNMYGAFKFVAEARNQGIKPIVGCECYLADERLKLKFTKDNPDKRYNQLLVARTKQGYHNLAKLSTLGYTEGLYGIYPRIDKALVKQYREGLMAFTGGLNSEIPYLILHVGERQAEEAFRWWHEVFQDDFYVELNRHGIPEEDHVNETLLNLARKYGVKYFAANEVYYIDRLEANAHDVLLCIKEAEYKSTPIGEGRGKRYGLPNSEYYFKTPEEMQSIFRDLPEAIATVEEIVNKVEVYSLERSVVLPKYEIPEGFASEDEYLRHLALEGAMRRYGTITPEIGDRLEFELDTIRRTGYPGYFLIVQDFANKAREMGVAVGPGRGSAAGSAVAYCTGITNVDPIQYDLLFERFLNPDRISLPDIDIDFDDVGRDKVLNYVIEKYGKNQVAQIITYGTMAAKSAIRDCARVMELSLTDANILAKMVPERPGVTLQRAYEEVRDLAMIRKGSDKRAEVLQQAEILEGSIRNAGTHACGVIITPEPINELVPVAVAKDSTMLVTQFDNSVVEDAGLLKMDFLGLTTLTIIKTAIENVRKSRGLNVNIDSIPLDDAKTYQLFQQGDTTGTFQFESLGMQKYLRQLRPDKLEDLIAMNALYRPGPMEYIPEFINRKHGRAPIKYDLPEMEEFLSETYGITVYQEQVMLLSQKLAGFSKGDADVLRKAMGKKQKAVLDKMKGRFLDGCKQQGHNETIAGKIWGDWEAFAQYAFNKSHSTCYSLIAYQTAYLKANFPAEYMAAVLTHSQNNLDNVTFFIEACRSLAIHVLGPDVNESGVYFEVNKSGEIRFGLGAIKGAGESAVEAIISERESGGPYKDIFDFARRLNTRSVNKKTFEVLALSGAFDCFPEYHRRQYLYAPEGDSSLIEKITRFASRAQQEMLSAQTSLFGAETSTAMPLPKVQPLEPYSELEQLNLEREVIGIYISGHPLDHFRFEIEKFCNSEIAALNELQELEGRELRLGGIVVSAEQRTTRAGKPFGKFTLEDYSGNYAFAVFGEDYIKFRNFMTTGFFLFVEGTVLRSTWGAMNLDFRIRSIDLLNELGMRRSRGLQLRLPIDQVDEVFIRDLEEICHEFEGNTPLYLKLHDEPGQISVELLSRSYRVKPVNDFVRKLKELKAVQVEVLV